jgi:small redox-active disulfide protein 2
VLVQVLGRSCAGCRCLVDHTREALDALGIDVPVHHVTEEEDIAALGSPKVPALLVDGEVVVSGWVPATHTVRRLLGDIRV